jgi:cytochrome c oxidase cbb3-type subunit 3
MSFWRCLAPALLALGLAGCGKPAGLDYAVATRQPVAQRALPVSPARLELGRRIYNFRCYYCHGYSGNARTLAASFLEPPPRDFSATRPDVLSRSAMIAALRQGREGTAMKPFRGILSPAEMTAVVDFVRDEFMHGRRENTRYHTQENGWPGHERYLAAYPFATGTIPLDTPWDDLSAQQQAGKRLYLSACVSCHDRGRTARDHPAWESRPLSYPRNQFQPGQASAPDATTSASPYAVHDRPPTLADLNPEERRGEALFQANCAFCHAADGTGRNWIGRFMEPHPRDLTNPDFMRAMSRERLRRVIRDGLPQTSMPAWKSVLQPAEIDAVIAYVARAFHPLQDDPR